MVFVLLMVELLFGLVGSVLGNLAALDPSSRASEVAFMVSYSMLFAALVWLGGSAKAGCEAKAHERRRRKQLLLSWLNKPLLYATIYTALALLSLPLVACPAELALKTVVASLVMTLAPLIPLTLARRFMDVTLPPAEEQQDARAARGECIHQTTSTANDIEAPAAASSSEATQIGSAKL